MTNKIRGLNSIELGIIAGELSDLVSSYFKNLYELKENAFLITFAKDRKEISVYIDLAKTINLTEFREKAEAPSEFALAARKKLDGCKVERVAQHGNDRILEIDFLGKEKRKMIIEMFDRGNLLLVNKDGLIEIAYKNRSFKERSLRKGLVYSFPQAGGRSTFYETASDRSKKAAPRIYRENENYLDFAAFTLPKYEKDAQIKVQEFPTLSKLLDSLHFSERATEINEEKIREVEELKMSIEKLKKQISEMNVNADEYRKIANKIFGRMGEINSLISHVSKNKIKNVEEVKGFNINVKRIDPKRKTITIELD